MSNGGGDEDVDEPEEITIGSVLQTVVVIVVVVQDDEIVAWTALVVVLEAAADDDAICWLLGIWGVAVAVVTGPLLALIPIRDPALTFFGHDCIGQGQLVV